MYMKISGINVNNEWCLYDSLNMMCIKGYGQFTEIGEWTTNDLSELMDSEFKRMFEMTTYMTNNGMTVTLTK